MGKYLKQTEFIRHTVLFMHARNDTYFYLLIYIKILFILYIIKYINILYLELKKTLNIKRDTMMTIKILSYKKNIV